MFTFFVTQLEMPTSIRISNIHLEQMVTKQLQNIDVQNKAIIVRCFHLNANSSENFVRPNQVNFILETGRWTLDEAVMQFSIENLFDDKQVPKN